MQLFYGGPIVSPIMQYHTHPQQHLPARHPRAVPRFGQFARVCATRMQTEWSAHAAGWQTVFARQPVISHQEAGVSKIDEYISSQDMHYHLNTCRADVERCRGTAHNLLPVKNWPFVIPPVCKSSSCCIWHAMLGKHDVFHSLSRVPVALQCMQ